MSFDQILEIIRSQNELIIYGILIVSSFVENIFPPFPGDMTILAGAFIAGEGNIGYMGVLFSVIAGGTLGGMTLYYIGRAKGRAYFEDRNHKYFGKAGLLKVETMFAKYGNTLLIFSRFFAGIRSAISIGAGLGDVRFTRMLVLTVIGNLLWSGLLVGLMVYTKSNWEMIIGLVKKYHIILFTFVLITLAVWFVRKQWHRRKN